jgi:tetratricopeptide (TPR) repeat protein
MSRESFRSAATARLRDKGLSVRSAARALNYDHAYLSRVLNGRQEPSDSLVQALDGLLSAGGALVELTGALDGGGQDRTCRATRASASVFPPKEDADDMIRRKFLQAIAVTSALAAALSEESGMLNSEQRGEITDLSLMNSHLWQVYQLARNKSSVAPVVQEQLAALNESLVCGNGRNHRELCAVAGELYQLAGELAFDANRFTEASSSYALAASAGKEAKAYDLWACALVRRAYVDVTESQYKDASSALTAAEGIALRGDGSLSTRYWVASVQAQAHAGMGNLLECERALDRAEQVSELPASASNGGWLRFNGSRLAEERGARYVQLGRLELAEEALKSALGQGALAGGKSFRRRGAVLSDLAAIGVRRRDSDQVLHFAQEAVLLAKKSSSGYIVKKLQELRREFGPLERDRRVADLGVEIEKLKSM